MNKTSLIVIVTLLLSELFCLADHTPDILLFTQANQLYKTGNFEQALAAYEKIPEKSNVVYYNMGNCFYKLQNYGKALAAWKRAEHDWGWFDHTELTNNIKLVRKTMLNDSAEAASLKASLNELTLTITSFINRTPLLWFQILVLIIWIFLFIYLTYLHQRGKKLIISLLFSLLALAASLLGIKYSLTTQTRGIVISSSATVRSGPGENFQLLLNLPEVKEVTIKQASDSYFKISFHGNIIGWMKQEDIEII